MSARRIASAVAALTGALALAPSAMAAPNTYCVGNFACAGTASPNLQAALDAAKAHPGTDRVEVGPGDFTSDNPYSYTATAHNPVNIVGRGADQTRLLTNASGPVTTLTLHRGTVSDLEVVGPPGATVADFAVALRLTGRGERLRLTGGWINAILEKGAKLTGSTLIGGGLDYDRPSVLVKDGDAELTDSTVDSLSNGVWVKDLGTLRLSRCTITARAGVTVADGGGADISDSLIRGKGTYSIGVQSFADDASAGAYVRNVTVVGSGETGGVGVAAYSNADGVQANVGLSNSVITRVFTPIHRNAHKGNAFIKVGHSAYDPATVISEGGGTFEDAGGNTGAAPGFVDAPGDDFHLAAGSPLVDAGDAAPVGGLSDVDRDGNSRSLDGDGNGVAVPDIGAFEREAAPGPSGEPPAGEPPAGDPPSGEPGGGLPLSDPPALSLRRLSLTRHRFRVGRRGTTFRFTLSRDAHVRIAIARRLRAGRAASREIVREGHAGRNRLRFRGRIRGRTLRPGRYLARVRAFDAAGLRSRTRVVKFRILR